MRKAALIGIVFTLGLVQAAAGQELSGMQEAQTYPAAGVTIAMPAKFEYHTPADRFTILRATQSSGGKVVLGVTLSAFPQDKNVSVNELADGMTAELEKSLAIRNLKVIKKTPMPVAELKGTARLLTYTFRGRKTTAARVFFLREVKEPRLQLCYVLTVEAAEGKQAALVKTLGDVIKSVKLVGLQHPREIAVESFQTAWKDYKNGFSIRPPKGWFAVQTPAGVAMGQVDYLAQPVPIPSPSLSVVEMDVEAGTTASDLAGKTKEHYRAQSAKQDLVAKVVSEGEAKLAGVTGSQFVLRIAAKSAKTSTRPAKSDPFEVVIFRLVTIPAAEGEREVASYALVYTCRNLPTEEAVAMVDKVAGTFKLLKTPKTKPAADTDNGGLEIKVSP
ncbi:MAG: hypothetical protein ACLFV7_01885 [Phycisphaerae bacterium]